MDKQSLVIGSGGREHALAWKLIQSEKVSKVFVAPGNGGTNKGLVKSVDIAVTDHAGLITFAKEKQIDLIVIGPDDALAAGLADQCRAAGFVTFGPSAAAAKIESSKAFAKELMQHASIATAAHETFTDYQAALAYVRDGSFPVVIKASGLALGKGVYICADVEAAEAALVEIMHDKKFGDSGNEVVIEAFLTGIELSTHAISDGEHALIFPPSQDHKAAFDNDEGPNTGGMGVVAPLPWVDAALMQQAADEIISPVLQALKDSGTPFLGLLYPGLMKTVDRLKVIEFNARFGDPETQVYMRLLESDLYDVLHASASGDLSNSPIDWTKDFCACVVLASAGYPGSYEKGKEITGIVEAEQDERVKVFHAGTKREADQLVTSGGRVLNVTATGDTLAEAIATAYKAAEKIQFAGKYYRTDIGQKTLALSPS